MQKKIFLNGEGDKWFLRNRKVLKTKTYENDILCINIDRLLKLKSKKKNFMFRSRLCRWHKIKSYKKKI